jgi:hypothetical protein
MAYVDNWPLLVQTIEQIILHPETWKQGDWAQETDCGTAFCVAGWVTHLAGAKPAFRPLDPDYEDEDDYRSTSECTFKGKEWLIPELSDELLGGDPIRLINLYRGGNTLKDVLRIVSVWAEEDGYELPALITDKHAELTSEPIAL